MDVNPGQNGFASPARWPLQLLVALELKSQTKQDFLGSAGFCQFPNPLPLHE